MNKFKQTLKIIEEGLLKPMSDAEAKNIDLNAMDDWLKELRDHPDSSEIISRAISLSRFKTYFTEKEYDKISKWLAPAIQNLHTSPNDIYVLKLSSMSSDFTNFIDGAPTKFPVLSENGINQNFKPFISDFTIEFIPKTLLYVSGTYLYGDRIHINLNALIFSKSRLEYWLGFSL